MYIQIYKEISIALYKAAIPFIDIQVYNINLTTLKIAIRVTITKSLTKQLFVSHYCNNDLHNKMKANLTFFQNIMNIIYCFFLRKL